jgi:hypothetical protein
MKKPKSLLSLLKSCFIGKHPRLEKMNRDLDEMENEITSRATVDGEDEWMLVIRRHKNNGECKT